MTLRRLDALLEAAEKATARPWRTWPGSYVRVYGSKPSSGMITAGGPPELLEMTGVYNLWEENAAYIVAATNAAEGMARLLMEAHSLLSTIAAYTSLDSDEVGDLINRIEQRFGGDDA